nr:MAG TPA: hypothetical protein [Caudoviricetes sp.]
MRVRSVQQPPLYGRLPKGIVGFDPQTFPQHHLVHGVSPFLSNKQSRGA